MQRPTRTTPPVAVLAMTFATLLSAPMTSATRWAAGRAVQLHHEEDGVSEVVSGLLLAGGIALIVIAVLGIIGPWAENEANNLPTSGS